MTRCERPFATGPAKAGHYEEHGAHAALFAALRRPRNSLARRARLIALPRPIVRRSALAGALPLLRVLGMKQIQSSTLPDQRSRVAQNGQSGHFCPSG